MAFTLAPMLREAQKKEPREAQNQANIPRYSCFLSAIHLTTLPPPLHTTFTFNTWGCQKAQQENNIRYRQEDKQRS